MSITLRELLLGMSWPGVAGGGPASLCTGSTGGRPAPLDVRVGRLEPIRYASRAAGEDVPYHDHFGDLCSQGFFHGASFFHRHSHRAEGPHVDGPHVYGPHVDGPHVDGPHVYGLHVGGPHVYGPHVYGLHVGGPHVYGPHVYGLHVGGPHVYGPHVYGLHVGGPHVYGPHVYGLHVGGLHVYGPHVYGLHVGGPHVDSLHVGGPHHAGGAHAGGAHHADVCGDVFATPPTRGKMTAHPCHAFSNSHNPVDVGTPRLRAGKAIYSTLCGAISSASCGCARPKKSPLAVSPPARLPTRSAPIAVCWLAVGLSGRALRSLYGASCQSAGCSNGRTEECLLEFPCRGTCASVAL
ncbi:hypothetical protein BKA80DRAFT_255903 [Phyllosticta citrichinensis]